MTNPRQPYYASQGTGSGNKDSQFHKYSGARTRQLHCVLSDNIHQFILGTAQPADASDWTEIALDDEHHNRLPFPATVAVCYEQLDATPTGGQVVDFRVSGFDEFGRYITSEPQHLGPGDADALEGHTAPLASYSWSVQTFSVVTKFEYKLSGGKANDRIHVGVMWQLDYAKDRALAGGPVGADDAIYYGYQRQGIGLPADFGWPSKNTTVGNFSSENPARLFEVLGVQLRNLDRATNNVAAAFPFAGTDGGFTFGASGGPGTKYPPNRFWIVAAAAVPIIADRVLNASPAAYDVATATGDRHELTITYRSSGQYLNSLDSANYPEQF